MDRYLLHLLASAAILMSSILAINWLADPYGIFGTPTIKGFNQAKPVLTNNSRIFKIAGFVHDKMDALILGTSRADFALSPKHPGFNNLVTYNMALPGQPNTESALIFKWVAARNDLKTAVIGLDFFASNGLLTYTSDFTPDNFEPDRKWKLLASVDTLLSSGKTFFQKGYGANKPYAARINYPKKFNKQAFLESEKAYMWGGTYLPSPRCQYLFEADRLENGKKYRSRPLEDIRSMIALAHQKGIQMHLFISPSHARQWEVLAAVGLWDQWEEWKRKLVQINTEEAIRAGRAPFALWDFSGYHSISTEALPGADRKDAQMTGYIESSHYKPVIGNLVLDRLFGLKTSERNMPDDFGVSLTTSTIDSHLLHIRSERQRYRKTHPLDTAEIEALAVTAKKESKCAADADDAPSRDQ